MRKRKLVVVLEDAVLSVLDTLLDWHLALEVEWMTRRQAWLRRMPWQGRLWWEWQAQLLQTLWIQIMTAQEADFEVTSQQQQYILSHYLPLLEVHDGLGSQLALLQFLGDHPGGALLEVQGETLLLGVRHDRIPTLKKTSLKKTSLVVRNVASNTKHKSRAVVHRASTKVGAVLQDQVRPKLCQVGRQLQHHGHNVRGRLIGRLDTVKTIVISRLDQLGERRNTIVEKIKTGHQTKKILQNWLDISNVQLDQLKHHRLLQGQPRKLLNGSRDILQHWHTQISIKDCLRQLTDYSFLQDQPRKLLARASQRLQNLQQQLSRMGHHPLLHSRNILQNCHKRIKNRLIQLKNLFLLNKDQLQKLLVLASKGLQQQLSLLGKHPLLQDQPHQLWANFHDIASNSNFLSNLHRTMAISFQFTQRRLLAASSHLQSHLQRLESKLIAQREPDFFVSRNLQHLLLAMPLFPDPYDMAVFQDIFESPMQSDVLLISTASHLDKEDTHHHEPKAQPPSMMPSQNAQPPSMMSSPTPAPAAQENPIRWENKTTLPNQRPGVLYVQDNDYDQNHRMQHGYSSKDGFFRAVERGSALVIIAFLCHVVALLQGRQQKQQGRRSSLAKESSSSVGIPRTASTATFGDNGQTHANIEHLLVADSPEIPETTHSVSTLSDHHHHHDQHNSSTRKVKELMQLLAQKQEECSQLSRNLEGVNRELTKRVLEQPALALSEASVHHDEQRKHHGEILVKLNQDLQQLVEGKDLQLLTFSTQVQQLTKDLTVRESQMSNLLSLYSDQKDELELLQAQQSSQQQETDTILKRQTTHMQEMESLLQDSKTVCDELSDALAQATEKVTESESARVKLQQELEEETTLSLVLEDRLQQSRSETEVLREKCGRMAAETMSIREQLRERTNHSGELESRLKQVLDHSNGLQEDLRQSVARSEDLEEQLKELKAQCGHLKGQLSARPSSEQNDTGLPQLEATHSGDSMDVLARELDSLKASQARLQFEFDDKLEQCELLERQVEHQKKLYAKQQDRNKTLLQTNNTLSEMMEQRQERCHDLEEKLSILQQQLETKQKAEESSKLEGLRKLRREKEAAAKQLMSTQATQAKKEQAILSRVDDELKQYHDVAEQSRLEAESAKVEMDQQLAELQEQHEMSSIRQRDSFLQTQKDLMQQLESKKQECLHLSAKIESLGSAKDVEISEAKEMSSLPSPGLEDVLSSEVSFLLGLPRSPESHTP